MREGGNEAAVVRWFAGEVCVSVVTGKEGRLLRPRSAVGLDPLPVAAVHRARPETDGPRSQLGIGQFQHDAADVLVGEIVFARELQIVERAFDVEEKRIATPSRKEPALAGLRDLGLSAGRYRRVLHDYLAFVADAGGGVAVGPPPRRGLFTVREGREPEPIRDVGDVIVIRIDLDLVDGVGRGGVGRRGTGRVHIYGTDVVQY